MSDHQRSLIHHVITIVNLLNVNLCSSASAERTFSAARRNKTWLRATQRRFNSKTILNLHKPRTDNINIVDSANDFVANSDVILVDLQKLI